VVSVYPYGWGIRHGEKQTKIIITDVTQTSLESVPAWRLAPGNVKSVVVAYGDGQFAGFAMQLVATSRPGLAATGV
jgi:hypothetical protein